MDQVEDTPWRYNTVTIRKSGYQHISKDINTYQYISNDADNNTYQRIPKDHQR
jgi:hypothetical protein